METSEYEALEGIESESESESESEAAERRRWSPPARATGGGLYKPRPSSNAVSQVQLQAAMARVSDQLKKNSSAIGTVNSRVNTVSAVEKKDNEKREKDLKGIQEKIQLLALLPLLIKPSLTLGVAAGNLTPPAGTVNAAGTQATISADSGNTLNALLPLLLVGGLGGSGGLGSSSDGGMDSGTLLILALALSKGSF
jgi:hypothetical protein